MGKRVNDFGASDAVLLILGMAAVAIVSWALYWGDLPEAPLAFLLLVALPIAVGVTEISLVLVLLSALFFAFRYVVPSGLSSDPDFNQKSTVGMK